MSLQSQILQVKLAKWQGNRTCTTLVAIFCVWYIFRFCLGLLQLANWYSFVYFIFLISGFPCFVMGMWRYIECITDSVFLPFGLTALMQAGFSLSSSLALLSVYTTSRPDFVWGTFFFFVLCFHKVMSMTREPNISVVWRVCSLSRNKK